MDSFRKPEMIIAIIAIIGIIAVAVYFYRKIGMLQEELNKHNERMSTVVKKIGEMPQQAHIGQIIEKLKQQDRTIEDQRKTLETQTEEIEKLTYLVDIMSEHLEEQGLKVRLPRRGLRSKDKKKPKRSSKKEVSETEESESPTDSESDVKPTRRVKVTSPKEDKVASDPEGDELDRKIAAARAAQRRRTP